MLSGSGFSGISSGAIQRASAISASCDVSRGLPSSSLTNAIICVEENAQG